MGPFWGICSRFIFYQTGSYFGRRKDVAVIESNKLRTVLVTGATGAIGKAIAKQVANIPGHRVILVARDEKKAITVAEELQKTTSTSEISYKLADISCGGDIHKIAKSWKGALHVLINNAAETPRKREQTDEGIERQFATNVLGYFRLIQALTPILSASSPSRIVNVASYWAGGLDLSDLEFKYRPYNNDAAYRQSKQADRMLTVFFANHLRKQSIAVNACHPGDVNSKLANDLGFGGHETPEQGARTPAWLATDSIGGRVTGKYFERQQETYCRFSKDYTQIEALYNACLAYQ